MTSSPDSNLHLLTYYGQAIRGTKRFAVLPLADEQSAVSFPGDRPEVGNAVMLLDAQGNEIGPPPDGPLELQDGTVLVIEAGQILEVLAPETPTDSPQNPVTPLLPGDAPEAMRRLFGQYQQQMQTQAARIRQLEQQLQRTPAGGFISDRSPAQFSGGRGAPAVVQGAGLKDAVIEGVQAIVDAKSGRNNTRFTRPRDAYTKHFNGIEMAFRSGKRYAKGVGVDWGQLMQTCCQAIPELFYQRIVVQGLAEQFNIIEREMGGNETACLRIPNLIDTSDAGYGYSEGRGYIKPGIFCDYIDDGETVFSNRELNIQPWHYYREYCPREWGNFLHGEVYVNDEEIPFESVVLEYLFSKVQNNWEWMLLNGQTPTHTWDGLLTIIQNDTTIPSALVVTGLNVTVATAVTEFERVHDAVPVALHGKENFIWLMPQQDPTLYFRNYRGTFTASPYNQEFEKLWIDSASIRGRFFPSVHMPQNRHVLTPSENVFIGMGKTPDIETGYDARSGKIWVKVEAHTGINYALSSAITTGQP